MRSAFFSHARRSRPRLSAEAFLISCVASAGLPPVPCHPPPPPPPNTTTTRTCARARTRWRSQGHKRTLSRGARSARACLAASEPRPPPGPSVRFPFRARRRDLYVARLVERICGLKSGTERLLLRRRPWPENDEVRKRARAGRGRAQVRDLARAMMRRRRALATLEMTRSEREPAWGRRAPSPRHG